MQNSVLELSTPILAISWLLLGVITGVRPNCSNNVALQIAFSPIVEVHLLIPIVSVSFAMSSSKTPCFLK